MNILGLSCFYHDAAAALLVDGAVRSAAAEERFTKVKHDRNFPLVASEYCLAAAGKTVYDLDAIAFYDKPILKFERAFFTYMQTAPKSWLAFVKHLPGWLNNYLAVQLHIKTNLSADCPIFYLNHHEGHAGSAFYPSPFERALILVNDGVGDWAASSWGIGEGTKITLDQEIHFPHSLGLLYSAVTAFLGFYPNGGEGKVMGLAAYGEPSYRDKFDQIIKVYDDGSYALDMSYFSYMHDVKMFSRKFVDLFGPARLPETELDQRHYDIAATLQKVLEDLLIWMVRALIKKTGLKNLCIAGGVGLNCVGNGKILEHTDVESLYVQPASGDDGCALGAPLYLYHQVLGHTDRKQIPDYYLGPGYSDTHVRSIVQRNQEGLFATEMAGDEILGKTSQALHDGKIVGWFQGRMEFGPRALGNRSILASPAVAGMQDTINHRIKKREGFRPFAPAVLREHAAAYFEYDGDSPFMLLTVGVKPEKRNEIPAVVHVDGTARLQTVTRDMNARFYGLITAFQAISGVPMVLNTSFNLRGEPIVCTPEDAIACFQRSKLDALVLNNFWIEKGPSQ